MEATLPAFVSVISAHWLTLVTVETGTRSLSSPPSIWVLETDPSQWGLTGLHTMKHHLLR